MTQLHATLSFHRLRVIPAIGNDIEAFPRDSFNSFRSWKSATNTNRLKKAARG